MLISACIITVLVHSFLQIVEKLKKSVQSSQRRMVTLNSRRESVLSRMTENVEELKQLEREMKSSESGSMTQVQESGSHGCKASGYRSHQ